MLVFCVLFIPHMIFLNEPQDKLSVTGYQFMKLLKGITIMLIMNLTLFSLISCQSALGDALSYTPLSPEEAKAIMDTESDSIILDVRTAEEYAAGHIPNTINLDHESIEADAETLLPDKDALILVYCRSGRRSKIAAEALVELGYTDVREFGGIIDWPYEVVK